MKRFILTALLALIASLSNGAQDIALPNGYSIVEIQPNEHVVIRGAEVVVFGDVQQYAISGNIVVGHLVKPEAPKEEPKYYDDVRAGYFLLDTGNGMLTQGLDEKSWLQLQSKLGIKGKLKLLPACPK